jgi:hypothetical protein
LYLKKDATARAKIQLKKEFSFWKVSPNAFFFYSQTSTLGKASGQSIGMAWGFCFGESMDRPLAVGRASQGLSEGVSDVVSTESLSMSLLRIY